MWNSRAFLYSICFFLALRSEEYAVLSSASCDWSIFYDIWIPSFVQSPYEANEESAGVHCLHRCCEDPSCEGLAIESSLQHQCYRYDQLPSILERRSESFAAFLRQPRVPRWSILKKLPLPSGVSAASDSESALVLKAQSEAANAQNFNKLAEESKLDQKLRAALEPPHTCEWRVYYDTWLPSFEPGEYEGSGPEGGTHCLEACCADPTCSALALESSELYQCYRYAGLPRELPTEGWKSLGDGAWLRNKKSTWSVFVKVEVPSTARSADRLKGLPNPTLPMNSQKPLSSPTSSTLSYWPSWLVQLLFLLALVYMCVVRFPEILEFSSSVVVAIRSGSEDGKDRLLETKLSHSNYTSCGSHSEKLRAPWAC